MSHTNETTYYNLPQYIGTDIINPLTDTNGAYSAIDAALHDVAGIAGQAETVAGQASDDVQTMDSRVTALESGAQTTAEDIDNVSKAIAPTFVTTVSYNAGDYVMYNGKLYRFTSTHVAGAWTGGDAVQVTVGSEDKRAFNLINTIDSKFTGKLIRGSEQLYTVANVTTETVLQRLTKCWNYIKNIYDNRPANVSDVIIDGIDGLLNYMYIPCNASVENMVNNSIWITAPAIACIYTDANNNRTFIYTVSMRWNNDAFEGGAYQSTINVQSGTHSGATTDLSSYTQFSTRPVIMAWHYEYNYDD